jgi:hypothetical protein
LAYRRKGEKYYLGRGDIVVGLTYTGRPLIVSVKARFYIVAHSTERPSKLIIRQIQSHTPDSLGYDLGHEIRSSDKKKQRGNIWRQ